MPRVIVPSYRVRCDVDAAAADCNAEGSVDDTANDEEGHSQGCNDGAGWDAARQWPNR